MRAAWLSVPLMLGLLLQMGCDSTTEPETDVDIVPVTPGDPVDTVPATEPDPGEAAENSLQLPPADATPEDAPAAETDGLQAPPVEEGAAAASDPDAMVAIKPATPDAAAQNEPEPQSEPEPLSIGSEAPALDVEHWVSKDFEPVSEFEDGKVYVVEFWATWCGPCVASMPHLAETQAKYQDQGVRLISISNEDLETVEKFMERSAPAGEDGEERTFGELTSAWSVTTDPDGSSNADYMEAANQNGIPTAFIVGKSGHIEWIGHPMGMDEPLEKVVEGSWDREAYKAEYQMQEQLTEVQMMARRGQSDKALEALNQLDTQQVSDDMTTQITGIKMQILAGMQDKTEEFTQVASQFLDKASDPMQIYMGTYFVNQAGEAHELDAALVEKAIAKAETGVKDAEDQLRPAMLDTIAHLHEQAGNLEAAIAAQQEAVDSAEGRMKDRLQSYLDELKQNSDSGDAEAAAEAEAQESADAGAEPAGDAEDAEPAVVEEQPAGEEAAE